MTFIVMSKVIVGVCVVVVFAIDYYHSLLVYIYIYMYMYKALYLPINIEA